jgi:hypothetical protein
MSGWKPNLKHPGLGNPGRSKFKTDVGEVILCLLKFSYIVSFLHQLIHLVSQADIAFHLLLSLFGNGRKPLAFRRKL